MFIDDGDQIVDETYMTRVFGVKIQGLDTI